MSNSCTFQPGGFTLIVDSVSKGVTDLPVLKDKFFSERIILYLLQNSKLLEQLEQTSDHFKGKSRDEYTKNNTKAEELRLKGNAFYAAGKNSSALTCYNESIKNYPTSLNNELECPKNNANHTGMALAFANRSAVFFNQQHFDKCLVDISKAISLGYPNPLLHKILKRKAECLINLSHIREAKEALQEAMHVCAVHGNEMKGKESAVTAIMRLENKVTLQMKSLLSQKSSVSTGEGKSRSKMADDVFTGIEMRYNEQVGRHLIARKAFSNGDIVINEKPYASILLPDWYSKYCYHCLIKTDAILPCRNCNLISYCSSSCEENSWEASHHIECGNLFLLKEMSIAYLGLRMMLKASISDVVDIHFRIKLLNGETGNLSDTEKPFSGGYEDVFDLVSHAKLASKEKILRYGISALMLLTVLRRENYFTMKPIQALIEKISANYSKCNNISEEIKTMKDSKCQVSETELFIASTLFLHINQIACNSVAITALSDIQNGSASLVTEYTQNRIATAIYPTASMLNHSCDPNAILTFQGELLNVKMIKSVKQGDEISICYGPHFKKMKFEERSKCLEEQYYFSCSCQQCLSKSSIESCLLAYKCMSCEAKVFTLDADKCTSCGNVINVKHYNQLYDCSMVHFYKASDPQNINNPNIILQNLQKSLEIQSKILYKTDSRLGSLENRIAQCLAGLEQYKCSISHFEKSLEIIRCNYTEDSIEVGYTLLTLSDLLIKVIQGDVADCSVSRSTPNLEQVRKCLKVVEDASKILKNSADNHSDELLDLQDKKTFLLYLLRQ